MDKQEAIKRVIEVSEKEYIGCLNRKLNIVPTERLNHIIKIISQIHEPQKPVVPKFVAEWIEKYKKQGKTLYMAMDAIHYSSHPCRDWFEVNQDTFARAWLDDYEIEQEKLYTVEIPNPNKNGNEVNVLMMNGFKQVVIKKEFGDDWKKEKGFQLTESEIKNDFEWAWDAGFAKPVEVE